jgi:anti-sigma regulatory factor (Ser/Thr protein kinase)
MIVASASRPTVVRFRFRSEVARISFAMDRIMEVVQASGCVLGQETQVELAIREALNHAVVHGNHMDPDKWVSVRCECDRDRGVSIVIRDEGRGFDPRRGRLITRSHMDEVSFEKGGHEVHLHKASVTARIRSGMPSRPIPLFPPPAPWRAAIGGLYQGPAVQPTH